MLKVDWQADSEFFLGTSFEWTTDPKFDLSVNMCQSEIAKNTYECFGLGNRNKDTLDTPYLSDLPIDYIQESTKFPSNNSMLNRTISEPSW